ncbi:hypothetical protein [Devosia sp. CN2-171]|uniref:hypothetical protein n=1 Tax=Devosia sp. CN2-171 TaxID=3400909 RepID=UPI003BF7BE82
MVRAALLPERPEQAESVHAGDLIMPFEVKACTIDDLHRHPTFADRTQARVKVVLREITAHKAFDHNLTLKVWANTHTGMTTAEVNTALLTRAATILKRTMSVAEVEVTSDGTVSKPTVSG